MKMACNGCYSSFSFLRSEKACPSCGFSYCAKCLKNKIYLPNYKAEYKVCNNCKKASNSNDSESKNHVIHPPDVFLKRMAEASSKVNNQRNLVDHQIHERLKKLKENSTDQTVSEVKQATDDKIAERLKKIKGNVPVPSDTELHERLAKLRGVPVMNTKPITLTKDLRTEQEQVEDLMKIYLEDTALDYECKKKSHGVINVMEARLQNLEEDSTQPAASGSHTVPHCSAVQELLTEDEEKSVKKIIKKVKAESLIVAEQIGHSTNEELPFCEICIEDANMRCLGCRYLFCKRCYLDHRDDDDGCNIYELYTPLMNTNN